MRLVHTERQLLVGALVGVVLVLTSLLTLGLARADGKPVEPPAADPSNDRLGVTLGADGRFSAGAFPDASGAPATGSFKLLYGWPSTGTSFTTVRVDGDDLVYGSGAGTFTQSPAGGGSADDVSVWRSGDVTVTQRIGLANNPQTGRTDTAKITYEVRNTGSEAHSVGSRVMFDTDVNDNDGAPFRVPGLGSVTTEKDLTGAAVPNDFTVFQNLSDASHIAGATLRGAAATPPDRLVIGRWGGLDGTTWDYTTDPEATITGDSAYATYWNPAALAPGQTRSYTTYYGLGDVTVDLAPPIALGLNGPSSLTVSGEGYTPNPFTVTATVSNETDATARDVRATLDLPAGLTAREPLAASVGDLAPHSGERVVSWTVTAAPSAQAKTVNYAVTATTTGADPKTLRRSLALPALTSGPTAPATHNYASVGDSYSSGEGNAPFDGGTDAPGDKCHRSRLSWARLAGIPEANHFACSGATIANLTRGQTTAGADTTGQLDRLKVLERSLERRGQSLDAVTVTFGGNDPEVDFAGTLGNCYWTPDCLAGDMGTLDGRLAALKTKLTGALTSIKSAATPANVPADRSKARVILVGYPRLFPLNDSFNTCKPVQFYGYSVAHTGWLTSAERERLNTVAIKLSSTYRDAAAAAGATYVSTLSTLSDHELCSAGSWVVPIASTERGTHIKDQQQGHPRLPWQMMIADLVRAKLR